MRLTSRLGITITMLALVIMPLGCASDDEEGTQRNLGGNGTGTEQGVDANGNPIVGGQGGPGATGADGLPLQDLSGDVSISESFIWIANSQEGTVSKIDTRTLEELGRYITSPTSSGFPSRTSVAASGAVAVANRGGISMGWAGGVGAGSCLFPGDPSCATAGMSAGDGTETGVTKIWAQVGDCMDKNGNGSIETSSSGTDILPWGTDECVAWHTPIPEWSNRPLAWAPPTSPDSELEMVWTAGATNCVDSACTWNVYRLNGDTGAIQDTISFAGFSGVNFVGGSPMIIDNYGPYGGASDAGGNFWGFNANTTHLFRVDALTLEKLTWPLPLNGGYGLTIGSKGRIFLCHTAGLTRFDPSSASFMTNENPIDLGYNGCMTDGNGTLWVGSGVDEGVAGLFAFDTETLQLTASHEIGAVKGVSIDIDGMVWGVGGNGSNGNPGATGDRAFKLNPVDGTVETFIGLVGAYSYSDMTGFGLAQAGYEPVLLE